MNEVIERHYSNFSCVVFQEAKQGSGCNGDSYFIQEWPEYFIIAIADGLGSGNEARLASERATGTVKQFHTSPVGEIMQDINRHLFGTRGVVCAVTKFFPKDHRVEFAGVGNITFVLYPAHGKRIRTFSYPGYLDGRRVQIRTANLTYSPGDGFVMFSDGIASCTEWEEVFRRADAPPDLFRGIRRMWTRKNDDLTVIIGR